jgi:hypothetical protein
VLRFRHGARLRQRTNGAPQSQRNDAWRDHGNRVGIWRFFELLDDVNCPLAHNLNSTIFDHHPGIGERMLKRGEEFVGHGRTNSERLRQLRRVMQHVLKQRDEIWLTQPGEIARHVAVLPAGVVPAS